VGKGKVEVVEMGMRQQGTLLAQEGGWPKKTERSRISEGRLKAIPGRWARQEGMVASEELMAGLMVTPSPGCYALSSLGPCHPAAPFSPLPRLSSAPSPPLAPSPTDCTALPKEEPSYHRLKASPQREKGGMSRAA
jgi:hypothetical protein